MMMASGKKMCPTCKQEMPAEMQKDKGKPESKKEDIKDIVRKGLKRAFPAKTSMGVKE